MKEVIGKTQKTHPFLPSKISVNNIETNEYKHMLQIANEFNNFFIDIGSELA